MRIRVDVAAGYCEKTGRFRASVFWPAGAEKPTISTAAMFLDTLQAETEGMAIARLVWPDAVLSIQSQTAHAVTLPAISSGLPSAHPPPNAADHKE